MRVYLSGPMTGIPKYNFPAFHAAAAVLRARGYEVVNPAEDDEREGFNAATDQAEPLLHYMQRDLPAVMTCDAIAVLPGWRQSQGAQLEVRVAWDCGLALLDASGDPYHETILDEAKRLVYGDRNTAYGHPLTDYECTAAIWSAILGRPVSPEQAVLCMIGVKVSRESRRATRDSRVDIAGYAECLQRIADAR
jgi:hypothetical protein